MDCVAQTEPLLTKDPPDKFKKFIKTKQKPKCNGIENNGFQDEYEIPKVKTSNSLEELSSEKKSEIQNENLNGVKKKSSTGLTRSESTNISGAKKKIRPTSKSPNKEYYQIWAATSCSSNLKDKTKEINFNYNHEDEAPPLPPRSLHKPLKRSHALNSTLKPPVVHRQHKPKVQKPEDTFGFELIDTDESKKLTVNTNISKNGFCMNDFNCNSTPVHQTKCLNESVKKLIGSDNYITTVFSKAVNVSNSSPTKEMPSKCEVLEGKNSHSSISACSSSSLESSELTTNSNLTLKPHKPLCRQLSNSKAQNDLANDLKIPVHENVSSSSTDSLEEVCGAEVSIATNEYKTPLHIPNKSNDSKDILRPHPRALTRVTGISASAPVCPPTPTHHSRRLKSVELHPPLLKAAVESPYGNSQIETEVCSNDSVDGWININGNVENDCNNVVAKSEISFNPRLSLRALTELHTNEMSPERMNQEEQRVPETADNGDGEASGGIPLPLRHLRSTRLPSIPERNHRVLALPELPGEHEDPLPPCKYDYCDSD